MEWLIQNIGTIIVGFSVLAVIVLLIANMIRDKQKGKSSCGCSCANCPMSGSCHSK